VLDLLRGEIFFELHSSLIPKRYRLRKKFLYQFGF
jgi:hypothetical protein